MKDKIYILLIVWMLLPVAIHGAWNIDESQTEITSVQLQGNVFGRAFELGEATYNNVALTLSSRGKLGIWPESELIIFADLTTDQKEWLITPASGHDSPHIHMRFAKEGQDFPGTLMYTGEYSMYLSVVKATDESATIRLHVSLPDYKKSYLVGEFVAKRQPQ
ncbi:MAG: hypothetical protein PVF23_00250 [Chromatiales bacterium]|jgi:hypothetical protein